MSDIHWLATMIGMRSAEEFCVLQTFDEVDRIVQNPVVSKPLRFHEFTALRFTREDGKLVGVTSSKMVLDVSMIEAYWPYGVDDESHRQMIVDAIVEAHSEKSMPDVEDERYRIGDALMSELPPDWLIGIPVHREVTEMERNIVAQQMIGCGWITSKELTSRLPFYRDSVLRVLASMVDVGRAEAQGYTSARKWRLFS